MVAPSTMSKILRMLLYRFVFIFLAIACSQMAYAIGDSGGCGSVENSALGQALMYGSAAEAERQIQIRVEEQPTDYLAFLKLFLRGGNLHDWKIRNTKEVIAGTTRTLCSPGPLLRVAVSAGNVEVVKHLLTHPAGVDPNGPIFDKNGSIYSTLFMSCRTGVPLSGGARERRRLTFQLALEASGSDINFVDATGRTAISTCFEADLVELYLSHGAKLPMGQQSLLDSSISRAVSASSPVEKKEGLRIVDMFLRTSKDRSVSKRTEWEICSVCTREGNEGFCKDLATRVEGVDPMVFEYHWFAPASRCRELVERRNDLGPTFHVR